MESAAGVKKGSWTPEEDRKLVSYIMRYGIWNWRQMPRYAGLARTGKSCRLRWMNYLRPDVRRGPFDMEEVAILLKLYQSLGNKWSTIAAHLPGRTDNDIKNFFHTHLKKRLKINNNNNNGSPPPLSRPKTSSIRTTRLISKTVAATTTNLVAAAPPESRDSWKYEVVVDVNNNNNNNNFSETPPQGSNNGNNVMMMSSTSSQVVILESNPNSFAPTVSDGYTSSASDVTTVDMNVNFSSPPSDHFDVSSFWYKLLAEAERL